MADFIKAIAHLKAASRRLLNAIDLADDLRRTLAQAEPTRSRQRGRHAGARRDNRLQCDECGGKFSRQMLPIHNCPQQAEPVQQAHGIKESGNECPRNP